MEDWNLIGDAMLKEYLHSVGCDNHSELLITYSELCVWFSNRESERSLSIVKGIFEKQHLSPLGKARLSSFMQGYAKKLSEVSQDLLGYSA